MTSEQEWEARKILRSALQEWFYGIPSVALTRDQFSVVAQVFDVVKLGEAWRAGYIVDWNESLMVGDRPEDEECARLAHINFMWAWQFFSRGQPQE